MIHRAITASQKIEKIIYDMKKNWFYLFMVMAIAMITLVSCDKDDEAGLDRKSPLPEYTENEEIDW